MNRRHGGDAYRRLVDRLRTARPDLALSSDFIIGFPGETDGDFRETLELVQDVEFASAYSFKYSPRPGTPASLEDQVDDAVKSERLAELQSLLDEQQKRFNDRCIGREMTVLFDRPGRHPGQLVGRSPYMQAVHAQAPRPLLGSLQPVMITAGSANSLSGTLTDRAVA
jgi:tRNA-2-methylthio-N6-dimethylallyladenosine synthase